MKFITKPRNSAVVGVSDMLPLAGTLPKLSQTSEYLDPHAISSGCVCVCTCAPMVPD